MIDTQKIQTPSVTFSEEALSQFSLMLENDFTLSGKFLRLVITGKGCDGFTYGVGFTDMMDDDFLIPLSNDSKLSVIMDSFTAFYLQNCEVSFERDFENNAEGFVVKNTDQQNFHGKFWKKDEQKLPPVLEN